MRTAEPFVPNREKQSGQRCRLQGYCLGEQHRFRYHWGHHRWGWDRPQRHRSRAGIYPSAVACCHPWRHRPPTYSVYHNQKGRQECPPQRRNQVLCICPVLMCLPSSYLPQTSCGPSKSHWICNGKVPVILGITCMGPMSPRLPLHPGTWRPHRRT
jgi:hypothetical protein